jgi:uncharacterized membrane protein YbhN (UPF0104 family)
MRIATAVIGLALGGSLVWHRTTVVGALAEMRSMSPAVVVALVIVAALERWLRADTLRRLLEGPTLVQALTIHDVGAAASKGIPFGGPLATGLRWSIGRDAGVAPQRLAASLAALAIATTFVSWLWPLAVLLVDIALRPPTRTDLAMIAVCVAVIASSAAFWAVVLGSARAGRRIAGLADRGGRAVARFVPVADGFDAGGALIDVRASLRSIARRPVGLGVRLALVQACGAVVLWTALRGVGVGSELTPAEFARVFFVVLLLSSFVPVPGGVGVVEVGLTGALVAAGVDPTSALSGVLVYRLLTYVAPIVVGAVLYVVWRRSCRRRYRPSVSTDHAVSVP